MHRRHFLSLSSSLLFTGLSLQARAQARIAARVGYIPVLGTAPIFVANGEGWLKEKGLDTAFTVFESGPNMIQALASGTIDVYVAGIAPLVVARSRGIDLRVVAATAVAENVFVSAPKLSPYFKQGVSHADAFKAFRTAEGRPAKLATQPAGSVPNTTLQYWLWEVAKADKADVQVVPMGIDATQQAVLANAVDGAIVREPALTIMQTRNPEIKLIAAGNEMFPGQPGTVVAVSGAFMTKHPEAVQLLVASLIRAVALIEKSPDQTVPHIGAALGKGIVEPSIIRKALGSAATKFQIDPRLVIEPAKAMQAYQLKLGSIDKELPFEGLFDSRPYENAVKSFGG